MSIFSRRSRTVEIDLPEDEPSVSDYYVLDSSETKGETWVDKLVGERVDWLYGTWEVVYTSPKMVEMEHVDDGRFPNPQPLKRFERDEFARRVMRAEANK